MMQLPALRQSVTSRATTEAIWNSTQPGAIVAESTDRRVNVSSGNPAVPRSMSWSISVAGISADPSSAKSHSTRAATPPWWAMSSDARMRVAPG